MKCKCKKVMSAICIYDDCSQSTITPFQIQIMWCKKCGRLAELNTSCLSSVDIYWYETDQQKTVAEKQFKLKQKKNAEKYEILTLKKLLKKHGTPC